jgi:hypothetical protein
MDRSAFDNRRGERCEPVPVGPARLPPRSDFADFAASGGPPYQAAVTGDDPDDAGTLNSQRRTCSLTARKRSSSMVSR